jgi:D-glycero-beta-D-manno-heptose 1-phosphate adenylyltransferase
VKHKLIVESDLPHVLSKISRPLVFTNGVFDILHRGHVTYLDAARRLGETLVVALNSDFSVRTLGKGPERPINSEADRAIVLMALQSVDHVIVFEESNPCLLIRKMKPEIYVKGGDYNVEELEETKIVKAWGGKSLALPFVKGFSTTSILGKMSDG